MDNLRHFVVLLAIAISYQPAHGSPVENGTVLICEHYGVDEDGNYVEENQTCTGIHPLCFATWKDGKDSFTVIVKGCWINGDPVCTNQSSCIATSSHLDMYYCCCDSPLCNRQLLAPYKTTATLTTIPLTTTTTTTPSSVTTTATSDAKPTSTHQPNPVPYSLSDEQRLLDDLFKNYDKRVFSKPVNVGIGMHLLRIIDLDYKKNVVSLDTWMEFAWTDKRLRWDSEEYGNVDYVVVPSTDVWVPEVVPYNSADKFEPVAGPVSVMVYPDGSIFYSPPRKLNFFCTMVKSFRIHECQLKMGSWYYSAEKLNLGLRREHVNLDDYVPNLTGQPQLVSSEAKIDEMKYACCPEKYQTAVFKFTFSQ